MNINTFRKICRPIEIVGGLLAISYAVYTGESTYFLGIIPFTAGVTNFCPICFITDKCDIVKQEK